MRKRRFRRTFRVALAGGTCALAFAALASVGAAVSPSGSAAASKQYDKKVTICHKTGSKTNPFRTIRVSQNAVKAHLRHGDAVGACSTATFTMCTKAAKTKKVKGAKSAAKLLRKGAKLGKCKANKGSDRGKGSEKGKTKPKKEKGKSADAPGKSGEKGKPADTPGNGGDKGKKPPKK
jgi:hypothetical protein